MSLALFAVIFFISASLAAIDVEKYLLQFGFLNETSDLKLVGTEQNEYVEDALVKFQEHYNLTVDGTLNTDTENLMMQQRCGVKDYPLAFTLSGRKWTKRNLTWHFPVATMSQLWVATKAFEVWGNVTNLNFSRRRSKPDIVINFSSKMHNFNKNCQGNYTCDHDFDGPGRVLGHAFYPNGLDSCIEVHLDKEESWYDGFDTAPEGQANLYAVLVHELGHVLGLGHSTQMDDLMYPFYSEDNTILSEGDILAIQYLYGVKMTPSKPAATTTSTTARSKPSAPHAPDLCKILPEKMLITSNHHFYLFHKDWVWVLDLNDVKYRKPLLITDYLPTITAPLSSSDIQLYQRPNGKIILITNSIYYVIDFPGLIPSNPAPIQSLGIKGLKKINAVLNSYSGRTYILYNDYYFAEIDECSMMVTKAGFIKELFPGIPEGINSAFRYINGMLYFFRNNTYYEFNEFSNKVVRAGDFDLSLFGIECSQKGILLQIKELLSRLATFQ